MSLKISGFLFRKNIPSIYGITLFRLLSIFFLLLPVSIMWTCAGNPLSSEITTSYTPLNVGDVRQLIFREDSSTTLFSIVGKTLRRDGTEVFIGEWQYGTQEALFTSYYLVRDGYYMATELDTTSQNHIDKTINPFGEQRLAKSYPVDGEVWQQTVGDSYSFFWTSRSIEQLSTFCGTFENVFGFTLFDDFGFSILTTYYSKGIGWIGTSSVFSQGPDFSCSYVRVNGKVFGHLWPAKDPTLLPKSERENLAKVLAAYPFLIGQRFHINGEM